MDQIKYVVVLPGGMSLECPSAVVAQRTAERLKRHGAAVEVRTVIPTPKKK